MKKLVLLFLFLSATAYAQKEMPNVTIKSENNKSYNVKNDFSEKDKLYIFYSIVFVSYNGWLQKGSGRCPGTG